MKAILAVIKGFVKKYPNLSISFMGALFMAGVIGYSNIKQGLLLVGLSILVLGICKSSVDNGIGSNDYF